MIDDDCDATTFQCRSAQERFAHVHHVKYDMDQNSSTTVSSSQVRNSFFVRSVAVPRCFAVTASTFVELTIGNCGANQGGQTCPKTSRNRSSSRAPQSSFPRLIFPIHCVPTFLAVFQREYPEFPSSAHPIVFHMR